MVGKFVCVTGASGYVASWVVKMLLQRGYTVNATVRNLSDPSKVEHLMALEGAKERLHLFEANLTEDGSFDASIDGCDGVFHTASPVILENINDPQAELIEPAVKGTLNVLRSCIKAPSVKRVVLTSSMATVMLKRNRSETDTMMDETWFSDPALCEEIKHWYILSKTLAEEAAVTFAKENGIDLVILNPGLVIGPLLQPTLNVSSEGFLQFIKEGKSNVAPDGIAILVDARDLAHAHILAFENPSANGRYCLVTRTLTYVESLNILHDLYPNLKLQNSLPENLPAHAPFQVSKQKIEALGISYMPIEQSFKDTIENFKERNLIDFTL